MNKQIIFKPKPLSKAEQVYLKQLAKRPSDTIFREVFSKVEQYRNKELCRQGE
jgi:hypothetical protein